VLLRGIGPVSGECFLIPGIGLAGAIGDVLALMAEGVFELRICLSLEVFHFSGISFRGAVHEHARAVRASLLAPIGIAREMIAGGGVAERPIESIAETDTYRPVGFGEPAAATVALVDVILIPPTAALQARIANVWAHCCRRRFADPCILKPGHFTFRQPRLPLASTLLRSLPQAN